MLNLIHVNSKPGRRSGVSGNSPLSQKLQELYSAILEHKDNRGRVLSSPFVVLPSKAVSQCLECVVYEFYAVIFFSARSMDSGSCYCQQCEVMYTKCILRDSNFKLFTI